MTAGSPSGRLVDLLRGRGEHLATAESLTGGGLGAAITAVPGASDVYVGGVVSYSDEQKQRLLGVPGTTLESDGAVSAACAEQMAEGIRERTGADWGVSTTGVAGPDPQEGKPVGLVFVGIAGPEGVSVERLSLAGDRAQIRAQVVDRAVERLLALLGDTPGASVR